VGLRFGVGQADAGDAVDGAVDGQGGGVEVDVGPAQGEDFGLPETDAERDGPAGAVAALGCGVEYGADLVEGECSAGGGAAGAGRVDEAGDVAGDPAALLGDPEGARQDPVSAQN